MTRVVWIDDEQASFVAVRHLCESLADHVESAYTVAAGYALVLNRTPDLILLDIILPAGTAEKDLASEISRLGRYTGLFIVRKLPHEFRPRIVILSMVAEEELSRHFIPTGIKVFSKASLYEEMDDFSNELQKRLERQ